MDSNMYSPNPSLFSDASGSFTRTPITDTGRVTCPFLGSTKHRPPYLGNTLNSRDTMATRDGGMLYKGDKKIGKICRTPHIITTRLSDVLY